MKISKLGLKNIKCFENIEISFEDDAGDVQNWSLIVGDNGQGKTTILRSLAAGLCDEKGASALLAELHGRFLKRGAKKGSVDVCLQDDRGRKYTVRTSIKGERESVSQKVFRGDCVNGKNAEEAEDFERSNIFAAAYGACRPVAGTESYQEYALVDSAYTLFNRASSRPSSEAHSLAYFSKLSSSVTAEAAAGKKPRQETRASTSISFLVITLLHLLVAILSIPFVRNHQNRQAMAIIHKTKKIFMLLPP